jgi:tripartite-type tricarboxylate transporter receptor subunit TctC
MRVQTTGYTRRLVTAALMAVAAFHGLVASTAALAQDYPSRSLTIVVPFSAGGGPDVAARRIAAKLSPRLGVPVIVDNRVGAGGRVGTGSVARAAPDGYTILLGTSSSLAIAPSLYKDLPYDPAKSLIPVTQVVYGPLIVAVRSSLPVQDLKGLISYAKKKQGALNYGSAGVGSVHHLAGAMLQQQLGIEMTHIPYRGGAPAWTALAAGEVDLVIDALFGGATTALGAGTARAIAVTGSEQIAMLPNAQSTRGQGISGMDVSFWWGIVAPTGTPRPIIERLNRELTAVMNEPDLKAAFADLSLDLKPSTPEAFGKLIQGDTARWRAVIDKAGIKDE